MKTNYSGKIKNAFRTVAAAMILFSALQGKAQCTAAFTYTIEANGAVHFQNTSTITSTAPVYVYWAFGENGSGALASDTITHTYINNGTKMVCLYITDSLANGCTTTICDSIHINNIVPTNTTCSHNVVYSMSKDSTMALTWNAFPTYPANVSNATWYWGDGSSSTGLYPSHTYSAAGTYSTCVTVSVSCDSLTGTYCYVASIFRSSQSNAMITMNVKQAKATGIAGLQNDNSLLAIYPNPNSGFFTLELSGQAKDSKELNVSVYNMLGEKVLEKTGLAASRQTIDAASLSNGTYFVKVVSDNGFYTKKISIQK